MMNVVILDSKPIDINLLNLFEDEHHFEFPEEYRNFLMRHNGGYPNPNIFRMMIRGEKNEGMIHRFLRISHSEIDGIYHYINIYKKRIPDDFLPIAYDPGGNLILIGILGNRRGKIYFWDHENESESPIYDNVHLISNSFDIFINSFKEVGNE